MRTVVFQGVRDQILRMMGWDPSVATANQIVRCTEYMQCNLRQGWEYGFWPEWMFIEERAFAADYRTDVTYGATALIWDPVGREYYESAQDGNTGHALTDAAWWTLHKILVPAESVIALEQPGKTKIGEVAAVYPTQLDALRDVSTGRGRRLDTMLGQGGITVLGNIVPATTCGYPGMISLGLPEVRKTVWVWFRKQFPRFSAQLYAGGSNYPEGYVVLWPVTSDEQQGGECYMTRQDAAGNWFWDKQDFPAIMEQFVLMLTMADLLRGEMQMERAAELDAQAQEEILRVWRVSGGQQGILQRTRFRGAY